MPAIKGQNLRVLIRSKCLAAAMSCTAHVSLMIEDAATKSDDDEWTRNEVVGMAWDVQAEALIVLADATAIIPSALVVGQTYTLTFSQTTGAQNRTPTANRLQLSGQAVLSSLELVAQVNEAATYRAQFTGTGALTQHN